MGVSFVLQHDETIPQGVRRIVRGCIDDALERLAGHGGVVSDAAVHEARKRFKEIRGVLRLVRGELGRRVFRRETRVFRDAARPLSAVRDAAVLVDSLDRLIEQSAGRVTPDQLALLRQTLVERQRAARGQVMTGDRSVSDVVRRLEQAKTRVGRWPLRRRGWSAIEDGLRTVYAQGRRAMRDARAGVSDEALHEWRKRAKDLRYALELLQSMGPKTVARLAERAHRLTDLLGDDHDLAVLRTIARDASAGRAGDEYALLAPLIAERREALQHDAIALGDTLYEERPRDFVRRVQGYWKLTRQAREPAAPARA